jgi:hypothetical protein
MKQKNIKYEEYYMPLGPYKNWNACIAAQRKKGHSLESSKKICGKLEQLSKGEITEEEYERSIASLWFNQVLNDDEET